MLESIAGALGSAASWAADSGAAAAAGGLANSMLGGWMSNYWGRKSSRDNAALGYEYSRLLADYNRAQDYAYAQKYNDLNYDLAARYAMNAAKWTVKGLRSAGLNPILAAHSGGVGSAQMGTPTPSVGGGGSSISPNGNYPRFDIAESSRDLSSLPLQVATAKQISSQTDKTQSETRLQDLNTAKSAYDLLQRVLKDGSSGTWGELKKTIKLLDPTDSSNRDAANRITENVGRVLETSLERAMGLQSSSTPSSAKDSSDSVPSSSVPSKSAVSGIGTTIKSTAKDLAPRARGWVNRVRSFSRKAVRSFRNDLRSRPIGDFFLP